MEFHNRLKLMRKRFKATQQNLANYLNINLRTYQRYEAGTIEPPLSTAASIAKYFDVPIDCLTGNGFFPIGKKFLHIETLFYKIQRNYFLPFRNT